MKIHYDTDDLEIEVDGEKDLLALCLAKKLPIEHSCEGMASCGTCRIIVNNGVESLPTRNELEQEMAEDRDFSPNERLACQLVPRHYFSFKFPSD